LLACSKCSENVLLDEKVQTLTRDVPPELMRAAGDLISQSRQPDALEIILKIKEDFLEIVRTSADFFKKKDLSLAPVFLRGIPAREVSEEVQLIKYLGRIRTDIKIEKEDRNRIKVSITLSEKKTGRPRNDLRVSLKKDNQEIESYVVKEGRVIFAPLAAGRYEIEIADMNKRVYRVLLELR
ncbi:MAG: hypothetical protein NC914_02380, partial [Candidatus Omnitrophica bacterium]|nr:hypothetical protein [Candidatus Omnitrophota bacterium]